MRPLASHDLAGLRELSDELHADSWLSICHTSDRLSRQAMSLLAQTLEAEELDICSSDEAIHWCSDEPTAIGNPRSAGRRTNRLATDQPRRHRRPDQPANRCATEPQDSRQHQLPA